MRQRKKKGDTQGEGLALPHVHARMHIQLCSYIQGEPRPPLCGGCRLHFAGQRGAAGNKGTVRRCRQSRRPKMQTRSATTSK